MPIGKIFPLPLSLGLFIPIFFVAKKFFPLTMIIGGLKNIAARFWIRTFRCTVEDSMYKTTGLFSVYSPTAALTAGVGF